jgi:hypothetical protein
MSSTKKCANESCSCPVSTGKYCSAQCEAMEGSASKDCSCPHPECEGRTIAASAKAGGSHHGSRHSHH